MLVQFGNNRIQKIPLTAKLDSARGLVQFWLSSEFFSSNYFQIGQHVVLLHIQTHRKSVLLLNSTEVVIQNLSTGKGSTSTRIFVQFSSITLKLLAALLKTP